VVGYERNAYPEEVKHHIVQISYNPCKKSRPYHGSLCEGEVVRTNKSKKVSKVSEKQVKREDKR
jgi:hypothetical protein